MWERINKGTAYKDEPGRRANGESAGIEQYLVRPAAAGGLSPPLGLYRRRWRGYGALTGRCVQKAAWQALWTWFKGHSQLMITLDFTFLFPSISHWCLPWANLHSKPEARNALMWSIQVSFLLVMIVSLQNVYVEALTLSVMISGHGALKR